MEWYDLVKKGLDACGSTTADVAAEYRRDSRRPVSTTTRRSRRRGTRSISKTALLLLEISSPNEHTFKTGDFLLVSYGR